MLIWNDWWFVYDLNDYKARPFNSRLELNDDFKWFMEEAELFRTQVSLIVYMVNNTNGFQVAVAQTSFKIQDVYSHKLTRIWLPLNEPTQVTDFQLYNIMVKIKLPFFIRPIYLVLSFNSWRL